MGLFSAFAASQTRNRVNEDSYLSATHLDVLCCKAAHDMCLLCVELNITRVRLGHVFFRIAFPPVLQGDTAFFFLRVAPALFIVSLVILLRAVYTSVVPFHASAWARGHAWLRPLRRN